MHFATFTGNVNVWVSSLECADDEVFTTFADFSFPFSVTEIDFESKMEQDLPEKTVENHRPRHRSRSADHKSGDRRSDEDDVGRAFDIAGLYEYQSKTLEKLHSRAQAVQQELVEHINNKLTKLMHDFVQDVERMQSSAPINPLFNNNIKPRDDTDYPKKKKGELPDKEFLNRTSPLTELFESMHIRTIYHVFIAILVLLFLNTIIYDFVDTGKLNLDFGMMQWTFSKFNVVMAIWSAMKLSTILLIYPGFQFWAFNRRGKGGLWDYAWLAMYVTYLCMLFYIPVVKVLEHNLPPASSVVVLMEQVRQIMKVYAFVRSNIPRALNYKPDSKDPEERIPCPDFSKYLYFLFAPTLVYRDHYPRMAHIRWQYVVSNFGQVVGCLFYTYFVFVRFCVPVFHKFGQEPMSPKNLVLTVFGVMLPSALVLLCGFFAILHSWLNAFAEMLRFADRMFYRDWWNSTTFANYYRTWNVVVHDWLYTYVYKDVHNLVKHNNKSRLIPKIVVFTVSALVHEYIISFTFRFFYPILFVLFGNVGVIFVFLTDKRQGRCWNIFMWVMLISGTGLLMSIYSMEYYARINCPPYTESFVDILIPRSLTCNAIQRET